MIIKRLECKNFRQFKEKLTIDFDTTGKLNIIYAKNGGGKTTLHQLFKWIFYGKAEFSNDDKKNGQILYNLEYESNLPINSIFYVTGKVEYFDEKFNRSFTLERIYKYKKEMLSVRFLNEDCIVMYQKQNGDWVRANKSPQEFLNFSLPESLSHYFFFDGERMISQFRGQQYNGNEHDILKKTIYRIFDLDFLSNAIKHIGNKNQYSSVLGKLSIDGGNDNFSVSTYRNKYEDAVKKVEKNQEKSKTISDIIKKLQDRNDELSENIGSAKTVEQLEKQRKILLNSRDSEKNKYDDYKSEYGRLLTRTYVHIILAKNAVMAAQVIFNKSKREDVPPTLDRKLIQYLIAKGKCICGHDLDHEQIEHLEHWLELLPPNSYINVYDNYINGLKKDLINSEVDVSSIKNKYSNILEAENNISIYDEQLDECDKDISLASKNTDIENMVNERTENYKLLNEAHKTLGTIKSEKDFLDKEERKARSDLENALKLDRTRKENEYRISIIEEIKKELINEFNSKETKYRKDLIANIEYFIKIMLNGERTSSLDENYRLHVKDDYGNESLSEGQFAVVTFAYISGILKTLKDSKIALNFPLVLDGPFSKLDVSHISNISKELPKVANQMIIFSKDDLSNWFSKDVVGTVYQIVSNSQQNVAYVEAVEYDHN